MLQTDLEWIYTLLLPESQGAPYSKQARYLKFKYLKRESIPQPLSFLTKIQSLIPVRDI